MDKHITVPRRARRAPANGALPGSSAWDRFAPILAALHSAQVDCVLVGVAAAVAHGLEVATVDSPPELDVAPAPVPANLQRLTEVLNGEKTLRLRAALPHGLPIEVSPQLFATVPTLPLLCRFGDLNILTGSGASYAQLQTHAVRGRLGAARMLIASTAALLDGSAAGVRELEPRLLARIADLDRGAATREYVAVNALANRQRDGLERAIIDTFQAVGAPMAVRDLVAALGADLAVTYHAVRRAADTLVMRGRLLRVKTGRANTYALNQDFAAAAAARIAATLNEVDDIESTLTRARELLTAQPEPTPK